ncbi:hypothetical protein ACIRL2_25555 [Embleya sp. NPDC127516]|uniref:hypothetical protein n=1 Tax=Embleya sp. NPDC127516 TaxID=3363990 RepID=UPI0038104CF0
MNTTALLRHFADLRDGTHGDVVSRRDKERLFGAAVALLDPQARRALAELDADLLLGTGEYTASGVRRAPDGGLEAIWALSWPEQRAAGVPPITLRAVYGAGFHHPHLRGGTVREWPLNVFTPEQAIEELPTLRTIAAADLHNLVFLRDFRIVPATTRPTGGERVLGGAGRAESGARGVSGARVESSAREESTALDVSAGQVESAAREESTTHVVSSGHHESTAHVESSGRVESTAHVENTAREKSTGRVESTAHSESTAHEESAARVESAAHSESAVHEESAAHEESTARVESTTTHAAHAVRIENGA